MSLEASTWVWQQSKTSKNPDGINGHRLVVLLKLANFANIRHECDISFQKLADFAGISKRLTIDIIAELQELKLITKKMNIRTNRGQARNSYVLNMFSQDVVSSGADSAQGACAAICTGVVQTAAQGKKPTLKPSTPLAPQGGNSQNDGKKKRRGRREPPPPVIKPLSLADGEFMVWAGEHYPDKPPPRITSHWEKCDCTTCTVHRRYLKINLKLGNTKKEKRA